MPEIDKSMVIGFYGPRRVGSIVLDAVTDVFNQELPVVPLLILGEATREEWAAGIRREGGIPTNPPPCAHFYFVSTD
jgi:hypothetical protein